MVVHLCNAFSSLNFLICRKMYLVFLNSALSYLLQVFLWQPNSLFLRHVCKHHWSNNFVCTVAQRELLEPCLMQHFSCPCLWTHSCISISCLWTESTNWLQSFHYACVQDFYQLNPSFVFLLLFVELWLYGYALEGYTLKMSIFC